MRRATRGSTAKRPSPGVVQQLLVLLCLCCVDCEQDPQIAQPCDPRPLHLGDSCMSSSQCPSWSYCGPPGAAPTANPTASIQATDCSLGDLCTCQPRLFPDSDALALLQTFSTREFDLTRRATNTASGSLPQFTFSPPADAEQVHCAVFVNPPEGHPQLRRISNGPEAIALERVFNLSSRGDRAQEFSFAIADMTTPTWALLACRQAAQNVPITMLQLGCWANDNADVIAATRLVALSTEDVPASATPLQQCDATTDGQPCYPPPAYGQCQNGSCIAPPELGAEADLEASPADPPSGEVANNCSESPDGQRCEIPAMATTVGTCFDSQCIQLGAPSTDATGLDIVQTCNVLEGSTMEPLGRSCARRTSVGFGTCHKNVCRERCVLGGTCCPLGLACTDQPWSCQSISRQWTEQNLGVCEPSTEVP